MSRRDVPAGAYVVLVALQVLVLLAMIGQRWWLLEHGRPVLLRCEPVDPRSLLSGDYVILRYEIADLGRFGGLEGLPAVGERPQGLDGEALYVALEERGPDRHAEPVAVSLDPAALRARYPLVIRGRFDHGWRHRVIYGVEDYFVPQGQGLRIEREMAQVAVEVVLGEQGESAIRRLLMDGREVRFH